MSWIPGWDSVAGAGWWSTFYFWIGIIALLSLGVAEVVSHRYGERKDELAAEQQDETQRRHDDEMARLHLETAKANERAAQLEKEALELRAKLRPLTTQRSLDNNQITELVASLARYPTLRVNVIPIWTTKEVTDFAYHLASVLNSALVSGGAPPKYEGNLTPVLLQSADGWLGQRSDGVTVEWGDSGREFSIELARLLNSAGIAARALEGKGRSVVVFIGAIPPN